MFPREISSCILACITIYKHTFKYNMLYNASVNLQLPKTNLFICQREFIEDSLNKNHIFQCQLKKDIVIKPLYM